jgi:hypothetical protein
VTAIWMFRRDEIEQKPTYWMQHGPVPRALIRSSIPPRSSQWAGSMQPLADDSQGARDTGCLCSLVFCWRDAWGSSSLHR